MEMLKEGKSIPVIAKALSVPRTSISRSITSIRLKAYELEKEIEFLRDMGFIKIEKDKVRFIQGMNPKKLGERK